MSDDKRGLGKVVYSNEPDDVRRERKDDTGPTDEIKEASKESFPASDPPGYATGAGKDVSVAPDSQAAAGDHPPHTEAVKEMTEHDREAGGRSESS